MKRLTIAYLTLLLHCPLLADESAAPAAPVERAAALDLYKLPANQWAKVLEMKQGGRGWSGIVYCPEAGGAIYPGDPNSWNVQTNLADVDLFSATTDGWHDCTPAIPEKLVPPKDVSFAGSNYDWGPLEYGIAADERAVPSPKFLEWGNQACYDPDRKVVVAFARGCTVEFDGASRRWTLIDSKSEPQAVYGSSLAYDPVNKEVVLANGGFSVEGCPRSTWVYRGGEKGWTDLVLGGKELNAVRLPVDALRDRLTVFRWMIWKHLELRATDRENKLDERSTEAALTSEAAKLAAEAKRLVELAARGASLVEHENSKRAAYETAQLKAAGEMLGAVAADLAGLDVALQGASPMEVETAYRSKVVPTCEALQQTIEALRVMPGSRMNAKLVTDLKNRVIVCFGGDGQDRSWGDTWVYHCDGRWWEKKNPAGHPPCGRAMTAAYDPKSGLVIHVAAGQTWGYDAAKDEWVRLMVGGFSEGMPAPAFMDYDVASGCFIGIATSVHHSGSEVITLAMRLNADSVEREAAPTGSEMRLVPIDGEFSLRDAATVADLKRWKAETDEWARSLPDNTWVPLPQRGPGRANWGRDAFTSHAYDPDRRQVYYRDGGHGHYHGSVTDHYDLARGRWFRSGRREEPPLPMGSYFAWGRSFNYAPFGIHTYKYRLIYNPLVQRLQRAVLNAPQPYNDTSQEGGLIHDYDPDTGLWSRDFYYRKQIGEVVPGTRDRLITVDVWSAPGAVSIASKGGTTSWHAGALPMLDVNDGSKLHQLCLFFDPKRQRVLHYGGGPQGHWSLYALDVTEPDSKWTKLETKCRDRDKLPGPTWEVVYIEKYDVFLLLEMTGEGPEAPSVCVLDPADNTFRSLELALSKGTANIGHNQVCSGLSYDSVLDYCFYSTWPASPARFYAFRYVPEK